MSKNGWKQLKNLLPPSKSNTETGGRIPVNLKEVVNAIFYVVKEGKSIEGIEKALNRCGLKFVKEKREEELFHFDFKK